MWLSDGVAACSLREQMLRTAVLLVLGMGIAKGQEPQPTQSAVEARSTYTTSSPNVSSGRARVSLASAASEHERKDESPWFGRVGVVGVIYHSDATIAASGQVIPGATATVSNNVSVTFDLGYDFTKNISALLMVAIPVKPTASGAGTIASLGDLGAILLGPPILSAIYRFPSFGAFRPYVGPGVTYAIVLKNYDAAISDLRVHNNFGYVLQVGTEYRVGDLSLFVDFKKVWLSVDADGSLNNTPVTANVRLNPSLFSAGFKFHF
jgi:outer membrane protein